jgi:hypothetical protein
LLIPPILEKLVKTEIDVKRTLSLNRGSLKPRPRVLAIAQRVLTNYGQDYGKMIWCTNESLLILDRSRQLSIILGQESQQW